MRGRTGKRVTMADVARESGISKQTVSAVLNQRPGLTSRFSEPTAERVLAAAKKLNYRVNRTVSNFHNYRHGTIGLLVSNVHLIPSIALSQMLQSSGKADFLLTMERLEDGRIPTFVRQDCVDAIITFEELPQEVVDEANQAGVPLIEVNTNRREGKGTVTFDDEGAMQLGVDYFAETGHKRPMLFLCDNLTHYSQIVRPTALEAACKTAGLETPIISELYVGPASSSERVAALEQILTGSTAPDCFILNSDNWAVEVYEAARRCDVRIPDDLSILAMHSPSVRDFFVPALSMLVVGFADLGQHVISLATDAINGVSHDSIRVPYILDRNGS